MWWPIRHLLYPLIQGRYIWVFKYYILCYEFNHALCILKQHEWLSSSQITQHPDCSWFVVASKIIILQSPHYNINTALRKQQISMDMVVTSYVTQSPKWLDHNRGFHACTSQKKQLNHTMRHTMLSLSSSSWTNIC